MNPELWKQVRFFKPYEFDSYTDDGKSKVDGTSNIMRARVVFALDGLRGIINRRMDINSAVRTESRNKIVKGAPKSAHLTGEAVDIGTVGWTHEQKRDLTIYARMLGFNGIGVAKTFIHLDIKPRVAAWHYTPTGQVAIPVGDEYKWL